MAEGQAALVSLIQRFLSGEMTPQTFDVAYRGAFLQYPLGFGTPAYVVLERLAFDCNEYVDVPDLCEPGDIDDAVLVEAARAALLDLEDLGAA